MTRSETISASTYSPRRPLRPRLWATIPTRLQPHAPLRGAGQKRATHRQRQRAINGRTHSAGHERVIPAEVVLAIEQIHCAEEVVRRPQGALATRCAMLMLDDDTGLITDGPADLPRTQAPVNVFTIHKEALVEQTHARDDRLPHHQARATNRVDFDGLIRIEKCQVVAAKAWAGREQTTQAGEAIEGDRRRRERTPAGEMHAAVRLEQLGADNAGLGMAFQTDQKSGYRTSWDLRIGIQQQHICPAAQTQRLVVAEREPAIARRANEPHPIELDR